ncbi:hypothetical protein HMPREF3092_06665 [Brevibacterium sp. HMSC24B04]|nr:hypothetical protein HMPREF3092_06665 [Brevibacterium sp. HMSC24B04]
MNNQKPNPPVKRISTGVLLFALVVILGLFVQTTLVLEADHEVLGDMIEHRSDPRTAFLVFFTNIFSPLGTIILGVLVAVIVWVLAGSWRPAAYIAGCVALASAITHSLKPLYARPRPAEEDRLVLETNFSFPSGHATGTSSLLFSSAVVFSLLFVRLWQRAIIWAGALGMTALICLSRLYLGVHYFTDVTAGCLVGVGACLVLYVLVRHRLTPLKRRKALQKWREQQRGAELRAAQASQNTGTRQ